MAHTTMQRLRAPGTPRIAAYLLTLLSHEIKRWEGKKPPFRDFHHSELAEECGCSVRTIIRAVQWLHANGKLHVERTGRRNRYHLHAPVEKVEAPLVLLVDNPRSDTSVTSDVTLLSPIEPDENLSNIVPDDTSEAPVPSPKEQRTKNKGYRGGVAVGSFKADGTATPTPPIAPSTTQELKQSSANVGETDGAPAPAPAEPLPEPLDDFWNMPKHTPSSEDRPPPRAPRQHRVDAGSVAWTFTVLPPGVSINHRPRPQEEKAESQSALPPERFLSREEGVKLLDDALVMLKAQAAAPKFTPFIPEAYAQQALEARRRQARYRDVNVPTGMADDDRNP